MSERKFNIGDRIMCVETGVVGKCIKFYIPTACEEQTMVLTDDGRRYHAPTRLWEVADKVNPIGYEGEENTENKLLNPFGEYVVAFAANHNLPISKAYEQLMVKARLAFFKKRGIDMWRRELLKNKLYAIAIIFLGALSVPIEWDATFFLFTLMVGVMLFFSKENWIV